MEMRERGGGKERVALTRDRIWPWAIAIALALVVLVNAVFIYIAVTGADEVVPSYNQGER
ncbi:MAG: FixH family protein [Longimicrobiales bacterium]|nr:FixH family protein [Longimicrobiales bacterium]